MSARKYATEDYAACRYIIENPTAVVGTPATLTVAVVERLMLLNLVDGAHREVAAGRAVDLAGLGVKTAREAQRLGITAMSPTAVNVATPQQQQEACN